MMQFVNLVSIILDLIFLNGVIQRTAMNESVFILLSSETV